MNTAAFLLPLFAAFTGWASIRAVLLMLFHPRQPVRLGGFRIQGLFQKHQLQIATRIGDMVSRELGGTAITDRLKDPSKLEGLLPGIEKHIDEFLKHRLTEKIPVLAMFLSDSILQTIKTGLMEEIQAMLPEIIGRYADGLAAKIDPGEMVRSRIAALSAQKLEAALMSAAGKQLNALALAGALVGFLIGCIQMAIYLWL